MNKTIKINGEFTKEELEEKLREFDKPMWKVENGMYGDIALYKNGNYKSTLLLIDWEIDAYNLSTISRSMAEDMDDLMDIKDVLDDTKIGYHIYFNGRCKSWSMYHTYVYTSDKHFKTEATAKLAVELLNESEDMRNWIKRMSK